MDLVRHLDIDPSTIELVDLYYLHVSLTEAESIAGTMKLVVIESPLAGDRERNRAYARACMRDSIRRGEAPLASHLLYDQPGLLDDNDPAARILGIQAGFAWAEHAELVAVYIDLG